MPRGVYQRIPKTVQKLTLEERQSLKTDIHNKQETLQNNEGLSIGENLSSKSSMEQDIRRKKEILERDEDLNAKGAEKDRLRRRNKEIEEIILRERPSRAEMDIRYGDPRFSEVVQRNRSFQSKCGRLMEEYRNNQLRLEPDDPSSGHLTHLRRER